MSKFIPSPGRKLYLAYGSNLNKKAMRVRCPGAKDLGWMMLTKARLVFRSVADVEFSPSEDDHVPVGVWAITRQDEQTLDRYEGVAGGLYDRYHLPVGQHRALIYMMRDTGIAPPGNYYLDVIREGYRDFGMPMKFLDEAVAHSWREKRVTRQVMERRERNPQRHGVSMPMPESVAVDRAKKRSNGQDVVESMYDRAVRQRMKPGEVL